MSESSKLLEELKWARQFAKACTSRLPSHLDRDDLQSAGIIAYLGAAKRFDGSKGASFKSYCSNRIRGAIFDEIRKGSWVPRTVFRNHRLVHDSVHALRGELERNPTTSELSAKMGISEDAVQEMQHSAQIWQMVSWEDASRSMDGEGGETTLSERVPDESALRPDHELLSQEDKARLMAAIGKLPRMLALVVLLHYLKDMPFCDVAKLTGVTRSRISQMHHQALSRLKVLCQTQP